MCERFTQEGQNRMRPTSPPGGCRGAPDRATNRVRGAPKLIITTCDTHLLGGFDGATCGAKQRVRGVPKWPRTACGT
eukprot:321194-Pyramimonas_sp.AAC.1